LKLLPLTILFHAKADKLDNIASHDSGIRVLHFQENDGLDKLTAACYLPARDEFYSVRHVRFFRYKSIADAMIQVVARLYARGSVSRNAVMSS
jgi:hypothetical protein